MTRMPMVAVQALALALVLVLVAAGTAGAVDGPRTIDVPGGVVRVWDAPAQYAISFDGVVFTEPRATSYVLTLRHGRFDPLLAAPAVRPALASGADTNLAIVQFVTQPLEGYRRAIRAIGGDVHAFLANHAHVVRLTPGQRGQVERLPFVRWVGDFHPAYRLEEFLLEAADAPAEVRAAVPVARYHVMLWDSAFAAKQRVAARLEAIGGHIDLVHAGKFLVRADLTLDQVYAVARWDEVAFIDRWGPMEADMDIARDIGGANYIEDIDGFGFTGAGIRGEVIDVGFNLSHADFQSRPLIEHTPVGSNSHGASTSGIIFGDGTANPAARGLCPDAQGFVASTAVMEGQARYDHTRELVEELSIVFQSASVGSPRTANYTTISADTDAALFDFDVLHCQSQSNSGNTQSRPQAWAKNIVSGGGVVHNDTLTKEDDRWGGGASTGPATDGRVKPDLTHFFDNILTTSCCGSESYTDGFGGTSGATPIICGHFGLFFDMWAEGHVFGNEVDPDGTDFDNRSHMTTAKAMMINTAEPYDWTRGGPNADLTRVRQGWGMPDLRRMYDLRDTMLIVDETDLVTNTATNEYTVLVDGAEPALKATMTYADPPGVPFADQHRVNDLSLRVTDPNGVTYWGNNGLMDGLWSTPGGAHNDFDTVENVFVEHPEPGPWTVEVIAHEIIEDGHLETQALDADYALVVSGAVLVPPCPADVDGDLEIGFSDVIAILAAWGPVEPCPPYAAEDVDQDCVVGFEDLVAVLAAWGPCFDPLGACCLDDGICLLRSADACAGEGGVYHGDGSTCAEACPAGACCVDGGCLRLSETDCVAAQGYFQGAGSSCAADACAPADLCADAPLVGEGTYPFSTLDALTDGASLPPSCDEGNGVRFRRDVWIVYRATCDGTATAEVCASDFDNRLVVYAGAACGGDPVACSDNACGQGGTRAAVSFEVSAGTSYMVRIGATRDTGSGVLVLECAGGQ